MKKAKRILSVALAAALMTMPLAGCNNNGGGSSGDVIKIGGLAPLTGEVAQYGTAVDNAIKMAVEKINEEQGGILGGKKIEYICYDEKGDSSEAVTMYERLLDEGVVALIGDVTSKPCKAVAQKAAADNLPMLTPTGTQEDITDVGENVFRTCFIDPYQGELMATYAKEKLGATSAAILYDNADTYSSGIADAFEAAAKELGMTVTNKEGYQGGSSGSKDFNAQLTKIKANNPDVLMLPVYYSDAALIAVQAQAQGITATLLGADGWDGVIEKIDASNLSAVANARFCSQYSASSTDPELQAFLKEYKERYGMDANMFAVLGYDSMFIMADAIDRAGSTDAEAIIAALKTTNYKGLTGTTTFDSKRNPVREALITGFEGDSYKFIENFSITTGADE